MAEPLISVIVPVYNVQDYLEQCLDSILSQTFPDFELICVNDGSEDNSRALLEEYKKRDCRIKIIDKENGGLSSARNAGMKEARGEFFCFIDSDDWIDKTMLEKLYNNITEMNADISMCAVHQYDEKQQKLDDSNPYYTLEYFDGSFDNRAFSYKDVKPFIMDVCVTAWNKLWRRSLIEKCNARFPEGLIFEDGPFFFSVFFKTKRVSLVRDFLYYYRVNRRNSIIQKAGRKYLNVIDVTEIMLSKIKDLEDFEDIRPIFFQKKAEDFIYRYEQLAMKYKRAFAQKLKNESSLADAALFPPSDVKGAFRYNYMLFSYLKTGSMLHYELKKFTLKAMYKKYKLMEILYTEEGVYFLKYKNHIRRIKKRPEIFDMYYNNDRIYILIFNKIKINFRFNISELEKFNADG